jgi:hypothetical protein
VNRITPALLLIWVCSLSIGVAHSTDPPNGTTRVAAISALDPAAPKAPRPPAATDLPSRQSSLAAVTPGQSANPPKTATPDRVTLDLRPPDWPTILALLPPGEALPADADETQAVAIVGAPPEENTHVSRAGIGSIYWAARHPSQSWRALFPIVPRDGSSASEDLRVKCATFARPPGGQASCP